jgi:hypothetical protein
MSHTKAIARMSNGECLKLYINGMGFRGIERVKGIHHTTVIQWVKQVDEQSPDTYDPDTTPEVGELDCLFKLSVNVQYLS